MNGYRKTSLSSSDEDLQSMSHRINNKDDLFTCQVITCEFCEEAFLNRYNYLVHNANHIIIPLLRQSFFRCTECHQQCRTDRKLRKHIKKKHPHLKTHLKKHSIDSDNETSQVNNNNNENSVKNDDITDFESLVIKRTEIKESEVTNPGNNLTETILVNGYSDIGVEIIEIQSDDDIKDIINIDNHDIEREKIQNRLVFEDEEDDIIKPNGLINDLVSDIKVSVNFEPWMSSIAGAADAAVTDVEKNEQWKSMTVSYEELLETQDVRCRYCDKTFPNRLSLLKHEPSHITNRRLLRRPFLCQFCDWYVACDPQGLKKHYRTAHPGKEIKPVQSIQRKICDLCKLKYVSVQKHMVNYHQRANEDTVVKDTEVEVKDITSTKEEMRGLQFQKRVIKVCDLCVSFLKNINNKVYYKSVGEESVYGERQTCDRCWKRFFSVNLVEMSSRTNKERKKEKPLSNMERLKNIQNRLKMINKIRKF